MLPSTSPPSAVPPSLHKDVGSIISSSPPSTAVPANDINSQPIELPSRTPSPPPSPSSLLPATLLMDTNNEIQSTPHSPDPTWRADSPSGDHVNSSIGSEIPIHILNHNASSESSLELLVKGLEEVRQGASMDEDRRWESPLVNGGDQMGSGVCSSCSPSPPPPASQLLQGNGCGGDEEEQATTHTPDRMNVSQSNHGSLARLESAPSNDVRSCEPLSSSSPQPLLPESISLWTPQHDPTAKYQSVVKEEPSDEQKELSSPPAPKVKMSLRDFALRKKKQRAEEMSKNIQDTPSSLVCLRSESAGDLNGMQVNQVGQGDGESSNGKAIGDGMVGVDLDRAEDWVDGLRRGSSSKGASSLTRPMVKDEIVDVSGASKPTMFNGYPLRSSSSVPATPSSPPLAARIQDDEATSFTYPFTSRRAKQEVIEEPIPTTATVQPITMDSTRYAAMYNNSRSISPINPDPHHFQSYSPPRICQEEGEIGEITDTPSPSLTSSLPMAALAMSRSASVGITIPSSGSNASLPRGPSAKRTDFAISRSVSSSSQVRHSPPTHPRSFNTSLPYRQPPPSASTLPSAARGTGVPPPTAPRALRQSMLSNRPTPTTATAITSSSSYPSAASTTATTPTLSTAVTTTTTTTTTTTGGRFPPYIPQGPSADRDRGCDMDQTQYIRSLSRRDSRESGHAWGGR